MVGEGSRWLSIPAAASWVSLSAKTIRRRIAAGDLRAYRCGKTIRVKTDDLEAMVRPVPSARDW
ncbi:helix-turn-helix domain-containing protein [Nocardioides stalactiti]|uniref:helix-turn-helix domain-containing protein n=1 Tax=Nocardioides stalactiti TaxID=2755356 RepID=UPI001601D0E7|nr:helix-turn-helix domain-containing protein [Nocardioides stalactiti]